MKKLLVRSPGKRSAGNSSRQIRIILLGIVLLFPYVPSALFADQLRFRNGDRISGRISYITKKYVFIRTLFGPYRFRRGAIRQIFLKAKDQRILKGRLRQGGDFSGLFIRGDHKAVLLETPEGIRFTLTWREILNLRFFSAPE